MNENYKITVTKAEYFCKDDDSTHLIEIRPITHKEFRYIKRQPIVVDMLVKMTEMSYRLEKTPESDPDRVSLFAQQITFLHSMLEESAVIVIEQQHPGLLDTLTFESATTLIEEVIDKTVKECYGLGEALAALNLILEKPEASESTMINSTTTSSTTSVEN